MMNIARLDLCKELYELSGWAQSLYEHELLSGEHYTTTLPRKAMEHSSQNIYIPAYDLGYLLQKLGNRHVELKRPYSNSEPINRWSCMAFYDDGEELPAYLIESADTPEDAVCKLAIELFKQGVLK